LFGLLFDPEDGGDVPPKRCTLSLSTTWHYNTEEYSYHGKISLRNFFILDTVVITIVDLIDL
jgi:hypothetical protein